MKMDYKQKSRVFEICDYQIAVCTS